MRDSSLKLNDELIILYQEILLNEFSLMRSMELLFEGIVGKQGVYYTSSFPALVDESNPHRSLDLMALTYAIYNGVRRALSSKYKDCEYDISKPVEWPDKCNIVELLREFIRRIEGPNKEFQGSNEVEVLKQLTLHLIKVLVNSGLLRILFSSNGKLLASESPLHLKLLAKLDKKLSEEGQKPIDVYEYGEQIEDLKLAVTLRNTANLMRFYERVFGRLRTRGSNPHILAYSFFRDLEEELLKGMNISYEDLGAKKDELVVLFKTAHGDLVRLVYISRPLPDTFTNLEGRILPFMAEPSSLDRCSHSLEPDLRNAIIGFFEKGGLQKEVAKALASIVINALRNSGYERLSCYQYEYVTKLIEEKARGNAVKAALTAPTGSGKTLIFLLYTVLNILMDKARGESSRVLFIYPRKALASDQLGKFITFLYYVNKELKKNKFDFNIVIGIRDHDSPKKGDLGEKSKPVELRGLEIKFGKGSKWRLFHYVDNGKYKVLLGPDSSGGEELDFIRDYSGAIGGTSVYSADILVTNHSMLNKELTKALSESKPRKKVTIEEFKDFIRNMKIIVVDEAHIYLNERESSLLQSAFIKIYYIQSKSSGGNDFSKAYNGLDIILSSATLTSRNILGPSKQSRNIIGVLLFPTRVRSIDGLYEELAEVKEFFEALTVKPSGIQCNITYVDYYSSLQSTYDPGKKLSNEMDKGTNLKLKYDKPYKLRLPVAIAPYPYRSSWTSFAESLIAVLHWIKSLRDRLGEPFMVLAFMDSKQTLKDVIRSFNERHILEAEDHFDRILATANSLKSNRREADKAIVEYLITSSAGKSFLSTIWDLGSDIEYFSSFHALSNYIDFNNIWSYAKTKIPGKYDILRNAVDSILNDAINFCKGVSEYAMIREEYGGSLEEIGLEKILSEEYGKKTVPYYLVHHADLKRETRRLIEKTARDEKPDKVPFVIVSTQTLEVGVDLENVVAVIQYGTDALPQEVQQRIGRSGRSRKSFYTSLGIIIFRNTGDDLYYMSDEEIVEYVYSLKAKKSYTIISDESELARHITSILMEAPDSNVNDINDILEKIGRSYGIRKEILEEMKKSITTWKNTVLIKVSEDGYSLEDLRSKLEERLGIGGLPSNIDDRTQDLLRKRITEVVDLLGRVINSPRYDPSLVLGAILYIEGLYRESRRLLKQYLSQGDVISLVSDINKGLANIVREFSYMLMGVLPLRDYTEESVRKLMASLISPGYIDPAVYDANFFILCRNECSKEDHSSVEYVSFDELVEKVRPLHTG